MKTSSSYLALACVGFISSAIAPAAAQAQDAPRTLKGVTVTDTAIEDKTKSEELESPRYTRPLLDTPQTITVITDQVLLEQNLLTLRDALSTVPGITFGAGEGGGGYGDSINLRGFSANGDILVDGVRDSAQYTRTDPFNLEQIEVSNGANSVYSGTGSVGGTINLITKMPQNRDFATLTAGVGTDNYYRATADINAKLDGNLAVRINAMGHKNDVPGRDVDKYKRWGVAPSFMIGAGQSTRLTLSFFHQEDTNTPQYGVPYYKNAFYNGPLPGVDNSSYFGYPDFDTQESVVNSATARFDHDFTDKVSVRNLTRVQRVTQLTQVDPPQGGTYCLSNRITQAGVACPATVATNTYVPGGPRGNTRDTTNDLIYNQTDFSSNADIGGMKNTLVIGASVSIEDFHLDSGNAQRNPGGATPNPALPVIPINSVVNYGGPVNFIRTAATDGDLEAYAVYAFDTLSISDQFELNGGVRWEKYKGSTRGDTYSATGVFTTRGVTYDISDSLFSYRVGLNYKPVSNGSIYIAYGNSKTPSRQSVNGGCSQTVGTVVVDLCNIKPETAINYEAGIKWNFFGDRLMLTGAVFRNQRDKYRVASNDPTTPDPVLDGKSRVDGISLGASGEINDKWTLFANYTYLKSKTLQSISNRCVTSPTVTGCVGIIDVAAGNPLVNTPKNSGSIWTTYEVLPGLTLGYGFTYQGEAWLNNGAPPIYKSDDYFVHRAYASYELNDALSFQLNLTNLFDEKYFTRIRNNGWATPGDRRAGVFTLTYKM